MTQTDDPTQEKPENIESDIRSTRRRIDENIDRIQRKLSPGELVDDVVEFARANGGAIASGIGRTVRDHPLPVALIGAGVIWLALSGRAGRKDEIDVAEEAEAPRQTEQTDQQGDEVKGRSRRASAASVREQAGEVGHKVRQQAVRASRLTGNFVKDHPVVVGAAGIALGAAIAAALPRSKQEDRAFGKTGDRVKEAAKEAALEEGRKVQGVAKAAIRKAKEEAKKQGLTPHGANADATSMNKTGDRAGGGND